MIQRSNTFRKFNKIIQKVKNFLQKKIKDLENFHHIKKSEILKYCCEKAISSLQYQDTGNQPKAHSILKSH